MADPHQTDHVGEALEELLGQFGDKASIVGFVSGLAAVVQDQEDDAWDLRADRLLSTAIGAQLDVYGRLVGEERGSLTDAEYRRFIEARLLANMSEGSPDELIDVFRIIAGPASVTAADPLVYCRLGIAGFTLTILRDTPLSAGERARVWAFMDDICPAGVGCTLIEGTATPFRYDIGPGYDLGEYARVIP